jgi:hypothetical protein
MSLKFSHLTTHWDAAEAADIIHFLDQLRDVLWVNYREDIEGMQTENQNRPIQGAAQQNLDFNDPFPF